MVGRKFTTVSIPVPLAEKVRKTIDGTGFTSLSDYVTFVLRELASGSNSEKAKKAFSRRDENRIRERLRRLGYL